jgi:NAD(P)-dependent dehydrogenase (short-subunit alcohol dehydrogenase family)
MLVIQWQPGAQMDHERNMIAVITGASRGAGKGIAIALGGTGATVYVTGRSVADGDTPYSGSIAATAELVSLLSRFG